MYYGHLNNPNFIPKIVDIQKSGKGYRATVVNRKTGFNKSITFTELEKLLNNLGYGYRVSVELVGLVYKNADTNAVFYNIRRDIDRGYCRVE